MVNINIKIKSRRFLGVLLSLGMLHSFTANLAYAESFEEATIDDNAVVTEETQEEQDPDEGQTQGGFEETQEQQDTYNNAPIWYEETVQQPQEEQPQEQPQEEPQEEQNQEPQYVETEVPTEVTTEETTTTTYIQEVAFLYTVENNEAILVSCKTPALSKIDIPELIDGYPVTTISDDVFAECYNVAEINIPYTVKTISEGAFKMCINLQYIGVASESKHFKSVGGVLYNYTGTSIIAYPADRDDTSYTIEDGVQYIGMNCFNSCKNLESIELPETLSLIGYSAFNGCINLKSLTVNNDVVLSDSMLENCKLETIYGYENSNAETYAETHEIEFQSIGVLETTITEASETVTEETTVTEDTTVESTEPLTAESLVYYAPERSSTDSTQKLVIGIIVVAMISFLVAVASRSRNRHDDDEDEDEEDDEEEIEDEDDYDQEDDE